MNHDLDISGLLPEHHAHFRVGSFMSLSKIVKLAFEATSNADIHRIRSEIADPDCEQTLIGMVMAKLGKLLQWAPDPMCDERVQSVEAILASGVVEQHELVVIFCGITEAWSPTRVAIMAPPGRGFETVFAQVWDEGGKAWINVNPGSKTGAMVVSECSSVVAMRVRPEEQKLVKYMSQP